MTIVFRMPRSVSVLGGGADHPDPVMRAHGAALAMTIDEYIYAPALNRLGCLAKCAMFR